MARVCGATRQRHHCAMGVSSAMGLPGSGDDSRDITQPPVILSFIAFRSCMPESGVSPARSRSSISQCASGLGSRQRVSVVGRTVGSGRGCPREKTLHRSACPRGCPRSHFTSSAWGSLRTSAFGVTTKRLGMRCLHRGRTASGTSWNPQRRRSVSALQAGSCTACPVTVRASPGPGMLVTRCCARQSIRESTSFGPT